MKNIICYCGDFHIGSINNFFRLYFKQFPIFYISNRTEINKIQYIEFPGYFDFFNGLYTDEIIELFDLLKLSSFEKIEFLMRNYKLLNNFLTIIREIEYYKDNNDEIYNTISLFFKIKYKSDLNVYDIFNSIIDKKIKF